MTTENEEWKRATRAGNRRKLPFLFGAIAAVVVIVAGFGVIASIANNRQERADRGELVYEYEGTRTTLAVLVLPVLLGGAAFLLVFRLTGGKLPTEYEKALRKRD